MIAMRSVKFRYWDKRKKRYSKDGEGGAAVSISNDGAVLLDVDQGTWINTSYIPEQYTGLKDMNGTEIFEGDCVRFPIHDGATVVWNKNKACFEFKANKHYCESRINQKCEIVGNIHETPELLE